MTHDYRKVTYSDPKMTYSYPKVTYSDPKVTYSDPKVTYSDPTHLPLPPPTSPDNCLTISQVKLNGRVVVVVGRKVGQPTLM